MVIGRALKGKPYAGIPNVRFDEGEVAAAATSRRGFLLYKSAICRWMASATVAALFFVPCAMGNVYSVSSDETYTHYAGYSQNGATINTYAIQVPSGKTAFVKVEKGDLKTKNAISSNFTMEENGIIRKMAPITDTKMGFYTAFSSSGTMNFQMEASPNFYRETIWGQNSLGPVVLGHRDIYYTTYHANQYYTIEITYENSASKCLVSFETSGGWLCKPRLYALNGRYASLPTPTRRGYVFLGWYSDMAFTKPVTATDSVDSSIKKLYAKWKSEPKLSSLYITGPSSVPPESTATYQCVGVSDDGTEEVVSPIWSFVSTGNSSCPYANISSTGILRTNPTTTNVTVWLNAWHTRRLSDGSSQSPQAIYKVVISKNATPQKVTVSFNSNGGSSCGSRQYTVGSAYGTLPETTKSGSKFDGWYSDSALTKRVYSSTTVSSSVTTLYAKWKSVEQKVTVSFSSNGGSSCGSKQYTVGSTYGTFPEPTKSGCAFGGWYSDSALTKRVYSSTTVSSSVTTLYARWDSVSPAPNNDDFLSAVTISGTSGSISGSNVGATMQASEPKPSALTSSTGSVWYNWTAPSSGTVTFDTIGSDFDTVLGVYVGTSMTSLTEVKSDDDSGDGRTSRLSFQVDSGTIYKIAIYGFNGASGSFSIHWNLASASEPVLVATPYLYVNWDSFEGKYVGLGTSCPCIATKGTFRVISNALWNSRSGVEWIQLSRTHGVGNSTIGFTIETNMSSVERTGEILITRSTDSTYVCKITIVQEAVNAFVGTNYEVTFDLNGGTGGATSVLATYGNEMPPISLPTRYGSVFGGYYTGNDGTGTRYYYSDGTSAKIWDKTSEAILYAKWVEPTFVIKDGELTQVQLNGCTTVVIPDNVTSIKNYVFANTHNSSYNKGVTSVIIPNSVTNIGDRAFEDLSGLTSIMVASDNANYKSVDGLLLSKDGKTLVHGVNGNVVIPNGVTRIGAYAFDHCYQLVNVTMPNSVTNIGVYAFEGCYGLTSMTIPDDVTWIGERAFNSCTNLTRLRFEGNAPTVLSDSLRNTFMGVNRNCTAYVCEGSTGWDVEIPGTWKRLNICYEGVINYEITFDPNGGDGYTTKRVALGETLDELPVALRTGYSFAGWWTAVDGGSQITSSTTVTSKTTYYAHWTACTFKVTLDQQNGSGGTGSVTATYDSAMPSITLPTRMGYMFGGYWTGVNGNGTQYYTASGESVHMWDEPSTRILYAYWTASGGGGTTGGATGGGAAGGGVTSGGTTGGGSFWEVVLGDCIAGRLNTNFAKAQIVLGALYGRNGEPVGSVQVKVGKVNKKTRTVKITAIVTLLTDGKAKKVAAKGATVKVDTTEASLPRAVFAFKAPIGEMAFAMETDGTFTLKNDSYVMAEKNVGGRWTRADARVYVDGGHALPAGTVEVLLPDGELVIPRAGKWSFAKAAVVKYAKNKNTKVASLVVDTQKGTNLSAMKLTYVPKTGIFKGSFKIYAIQDGKLKRYTAKVVGVVVDGKGWGRAVGPKGARWGVTVE